MDNYILGIDIGGTNLKTGIFSIKKKKILEKKTVKTEKKLKYFTMQLKDIVFFYNNKYKIKGIGIGFPGNISPQGEILFSPHIPDSVGFNIKNFFKKDLKTNIKIENDANLFALAHYKFSKEKINDLICLTIGTGIGGGAVINGKLFQNSRGIGTEFGHICVVPNGEPCSCGKNGCLEAYSSSSGMIKRYKDKSIKEFIDLFNLAKNGDKKALKIIKEGFYYLGVGCGSLVNIFAPEIIFFAGGVASVFENFYNDFYNGFEKNILNFLKNKVKFKKSFIEDGGILGAIALWI